MDRALLSHRRRASLQGSAGLTGDSVKRGGGGGGGTRTLPRTASHTGIPSVTGPGSARGSRPASARAPASVPDEPTDAD